MIRGVLEPVPMSGTIQGVFCLGMTFGHGILLKNGAVDRRLVAHELVHVMLRYFHSLADVGDTAL